jgi:hypothetical protein
MSFNPCKMKLPKRLNESGVEKRIRSQMRVVEFSVEKKQRCVSFLLVPVAKKHNTKQDPFSGSSLNQEFYYNVFKISERYLRFFLISVVNFYYIINKLIILLCIVSL